MQTKTWAVAIILAVFGAPIVADAQPGRGDSAPPPGVDTEPTVSPGSPVINATDSKSETAASVSSEPGAGTADAAVPASVSGSVAEPRTTAGPSPHTAVQSGSGESPRSAAHGAVVAAPLSTSGTALVAGASTADHAAATPVVSTEAYEPPWKAKPDVDVGGFVHALYELHDGQAEPSQAFEVQRARLGVELKQGDLLDGQLELELTAGLGRGSASEPLRDAYVRVSPLRALRFRLGQFKKPFGGLELWGRGTIPLIDRGASSAWMTGTLGYGGRDIGAQLEGRVLESPRLDYAIGIFNGSGANAADEGESKDTVARVEVRPVEWLEVSGSGSLKTFDEGGGMGLPARGAMAEVDIKAEMKRLTVLVEGTYGQNYLSIDEAKSWSALLLATYKIPLTETWKLKLEPLARAEVLKVEDHVRDAQILSGAAGANLHVGKLFRLMVQGEVLRPRKNALELWTDSNRLLVQAALNLR